jgi:hypothetical protein
LLIARHVADHGAHTAVLFIRQSYIGLRDAERQARLIFHAVFGKHVIYNSQTRVWRFPNGATESRRVFRRLQISRGLEHEQTETIFTGSEGAGGSDAARA